MSAGKYWNPTMTIEHQLAMLQDWRVENPPPKGRTVTEHLQACADAGDIAARRILLSGLYSAGSDATKAPAPAPASIPPAVLDREHRLATQRVPAGKQNREPRRPIVQSDRVTPWLK